MIDVDELLRSELDRLVPAGSHPDWDFVVAGSGLNERRTRSRIAAGAALVAVAAVVGLTTPLGPAIARSLSGFSAWLAGEPGTPASQKQERAFARANARSWLAFPKGTELRRLVSRQVGSTRVELLGFRSGSSEFCLRVVVQGRSRTAKQSCAALSDLRLAGAPVRVVMVDQPVGKGTKTAWYGVDHFRSSNLQITAGIVDDSVRSVVLRDDQGRHRVTARANAFLYVAVHPNVGQRVTSIKATTAGGVVSVPFAPSPFGFGVGGSGAAAPVPSLPIQRHVTGGRIGWLDRHEPRGKPLSVLPTRLRSGLLGYRGGTPARTRVVFGRVLTPDPALPSRVVFTLNAHHAGGPAAGLCITIAAASGGGGGCGPYPAMFESSPIEGGVFGDGPGQFSTLDGAVSDDVARLQLLLANGQRLSVPLVDNAFIATVSRTRLPARLVAFDRAGKVIGLGYPIRDVASGTVSSAARGRATQLLQARGPHGSHGELLVGPSTTGGECMYVRHFLDSHTAGMSTVCSGPRWSGAPLQLSTDTTPAHFVSGRVRSDVTAVRLLYADGAVTTLHPTRGYVLAAVSERHLQRASELIGADGLARAGRVVGHQSFLPRKR